MNILNFFKWVPCPEKTGYFKAKLLTWPISIDLLRFPTDSWISPHVDEIPNRKHYRCQLVIKGNDVWDFRCMNPFLSVFNGRLVGYRADTNNHYSFPVKGQGKEVIVLSVGLFLKKSQK